MFAERDFQVKRAQINDELRRRELERLLSQTKGTLRERTLRRGGQLLRQRLLGDRRTIPAATPDPC